MLLVAAQFSPRPPAQTRPSCESLDHPLFGSVVCAPGDADGDGVPDLIVADPCWENDNGTARAWLVSGKTMRVLFARNFGGGSTLVELSICGIADTDGDDTRDWLLSPSWFSDEPEPKPTIVSGKGGGFLRELDSRKLEAGLLDRTGLELRTPYFRDLVGMRSKAGQVLLPLDDFNSDGVRDCAVRDQDRVALLSGKDGRRLRLIEPPATEAWSNFGGAIAAMGDVDGDKLCDIAIGSPDWGVADGRVQVFSSATGKCLYTAEGDGAGWHWGRRLAALGDIEGDGISELAIASWHARSHDPGRARIVSGKDGRTLVTFLRKGNDLTIEKRSPATLPK
jgi:hypothetical protein